MNIVLIETSGNQRYIFATNKLRENVGASELTYRVGTRTVLEAVEKITHKRIYDDDVNILRRNLLDGKTNPHIGNGNLVEVIVATSGKAILLIDDDEHRSISQQVIREATQRALREMPGLTVHGAISEISFDTLEEEDAGGKFRLHEAIGEVHRKLERVRHEMPGNEQRFQRLPFIAPCATSGLPAQTFDREGPDEILVSNLSKTKRDNSPEGLDRLTKVIEAVEKNLRLIESVDTLEKIFKELRWLAVIHADGNGVGEIFRHFDKHTGLADRRCTARAYIEKYRRFSLALDVCTINATAAALKHLQQRWHQEPQKIETIEVPAVPVVLGGDDLTIICDGQYALKFTHEFLRQFEKETERITEHEYLEQDINDDSVLVEGETVFDRLTGIIPDIAFEAFGVRRLGICAGVAIVKPHFPFHQAYELAEQLLKSAKQVKEKVKRKHNGEDVPQPCSALDYHILYDSTASRLEEIRDRMKSDGKATWLFARPYVVSDISETLDAEIIESEWCRRRLWAELDKRVAAMLERDKDGDNKSELPNSQLHTLREALYLGKAETDARVKLIRHRYNKTETEKVFDALLCDQSKEKSTLFFFEEREGVPGNATHFLDALDIVDFRKGEEAKDGRLVDKQSTNGAVA